MTTPRPRIAGPTYRYGPPASPPGADLIAKAEQVAVSEALQRAIEEVERVRIREGQRTYSPDRSPKDVKADALDVLRRLREENRP